MSPLENMAQYLETLDPTVKQNVTIVTPESLDHPHLYHMSTDPKIKSFRPNISRRTMVKEDRSVPRISTAPTLCGAIIGYAAAEGDFRYQERERGGFHGGWYIYAFDFQAALRPNKKILADVEATDEHWLVPYSAEQWDVKAHVIGKFFYREIRSRWENGLVNHTVEVAIEVLGDTPLHLAPEVLLKKGYWSLEIDNLHNHSMIKALKVDNLTELTRNEYRDYKRVHADLLAYPPSATW